MAVPNQRTNLGPLTATFSGPSSCSVLDGSFTKDGGALNGALGYSCRARGNGQIFGPDPSCFPSSLASYINAGDQWLSTIAVYSPGNICPNGFSSACTMTRSANDRPPTTAGILQTANRAMFNILEIGETAIGCCPRYVNHGIDEPRFIADFPVANSGYACAEDDIYKCYTPGTVSQVLTGIIRETSCTPVTTTFTIQSLSSTTSTTSIANGRRLILIQGSPNGDTDSPSSTSPGSSSSDPRSTSTPGQGGGSGGSSPEQTSGSSPAPNAAGNGGGGLTTGAKVAIGVTIPLVALLAGFVVFMLFFIRRKRRAKAEDEKAAMLAASAPGPFPPPPGPQELAGTAGYAYQQPGQQQFYKSELLGQPISEAPGQTVYDQTSELQGNNQQLSWNQMPAHQQTPAPNYTELPAKASEKAITNSNIPPSKAPPVSLPAPAASQNPAQQDNEPWKWNEPLYPEKI
ncbi:hypothetical protein NLG97_g6804 [Lecanicillium saksenae]|uniref:Uncharacterized protein n=1 Tax=Lecanicillium saksenae TaxID=468837 RepID=A0ACC1QQ68_9HYPO|nr:hypothetical protein NLG97_g6804 [Lecanicillium saksenae]